MAPDSVPGQGTKILQASQYSQKKNHPMILIQVIHRYTLKTAAQPQWFSAMTALKSSAAAAKSLQSCPTLCDPIDSSPPGSPIPGILQARTLEWVAISFSNASKWKVKVKSLSRIRLSATPWTAAIWEAFKYPWCQVPPPACSGVEPNTSSHSNV